MRWVTTGRLRVLDWDIENRPLAYRGGDVPPTADVTAIAACWTDTPDDVRVWLQTKDDRSRVRMLRAFVEMYDEADIVTGHFILRHDLPIVNGALLEHGLPPLSPKRVSDTLVHLVKFKDLAKSQEALSEMLGLEAPKVHMSQPKWRAANRLTRHGERHTIERVAGDVRQHMQMRAALIERGLLKPPVMWSPN